MLLLTSQFNYMDMCSEHGEDNVAKSTALVIVKFCHFMQEVGDLILTYELNK